VACGYADGYPRHAPSARGARQRHAHAHRGRVSMDMITVDISAFPARASARRTCERGYSADEVAAAAGTLSYELLCALAPRVPVVEVP